jgi:hypothetical protein
MMRNVLADVAQMHTALELELWASWMLGQTWKQRTRQPHFSELDWMLTVGAPVVAMIAEVGGARARKALTAISLLERGALGSYAGAIALSLPGARTPPWLSDMSDARLVRARHGASAGDGEAVLLDLERGGTHELTLAVFMDDRLDGAVKWIRLVGPVPSPSAGDPMGDMLEEADLASVATRVLTGIATTDLNPRTEAFREFADLRGLLLARLLDVDR